LSLPQSGLQIIGQSTAMPDDTRPSPDAALHSNQRVARSHRFREYRQEPAMAQFGQSLDITGHHGQPVVAPHR
jgi:hypothetical protein